MDPNSNGINNNELFDNQDPNGKHDKRFFRFQDLMRHRVRDILLVSSMYDAYILGEDGQLHELLFEEYRGLNLSNTPGIVRVSDGGKALELAGEDGGFDLIITTLHLDDMHALDFAKKLRKAGNNTPLVLLTYDSRELNDLTAGHDLKCFDRVFMWQGNFRIFLAIIKCIEDNLNVERDTRLVGVQSVILIEDSVKFYSSYLPMIYTQLMRHSQRVIEEGINLAHRILRMRARPKILLCDTYEEAWEFYQLYHESILGVISDIRFPREGKSDPEAGIDFARNVKERHPDIPILLQSNDEGMKEKANAVGASFLMKNSPRLLHRLKKFMKQYFSFGDFIFCLPDGTEVGKAHDLRELEEKLHTIPEESLIYHGERNHFSNWLKARTEFYLAHKLRPRRVTEYKSSEEVRQFLISCLHDFHIAQRQGMIVDFDPSTYNPTGSFARIGGGSLGGKGRGLAFGNNLINTYQVQNRFEGINISVPSTLILETDVFDNFLEQNDLGEFAINSRDDEKIIKRFLDADMPSNVVTWMRDLLKIVKYPLAIRSSSLLEDSQFQPFAGVYETFMVPNNHNDLDVRLVELLSAIKRVYASTFSNRAKSYIAATPYRLEEEKMAVIIQKLVGHKIENRFYPQFSGVARSFNFYPIKPMKADDGICSVALGLGAMVVEGGATIRFCPKYPKHLVQFSTVDDSITYSQKEFYALEIPEADARYNHRDLRPLLKMGLDVAEKDDVLGVVGSTYSVENNVIYDGISRNGVRIVSFAPILKSNLFPLPEILDLILEIGQRGMNTQVEIEFSVNLSVASGQPKEFRLLQLRPMVINQESEQLALGDFKRRELVCRSDKILGNGAIFGIRDVVFVDRDQFDRANSVEAAQEIALFNLELIAEKRPYILIGVGRWGSADPWLGIPVSWDQISGVRAIVEAEFQDIKVSPSQGTHFFQNLTAFKVGYFTIRADSKKDFLDWKWLSAQKAVKERKYSRHVRLDSDLVIKMNGQEGRGIILKPTVK